jgi:hypothetical protein
LRYGLHAVDGIRFLFFPIRNDQSGGNKKNIPIEKLRETIKKVESLADMRRKMGQENVA